jgi:hypothetical protein
MPEDAVGLILSLYSFAVIGYICAAIFSEWSRED